MAGKPDQVINLAEETLAVTARMCPRCGAIVYLKLADQVLDGEQMHKRWHQTR